MPGDFSFPLLVLDVQGPRKTGAQWQTISLAYGAPSIIFAAMKRAILTLLFFIGIAGFAQGQVHPHAIGARFGATNFGSGAELSYQHGMGDANRLELDLGWRGNRSRNNDYSRVGLSGIYHWVFDISGGFNWFVGPGAQIGIYEDRNEPENDGIHIGVGGQIGVEYDFNESDVPLLLGLDIRPMFDFIGNFNGFGYGLALSLRYTF